MNIRWQALILIILVITSLTLTKLNSGASFAKNPQPQENTEATSNKPPHSLSYQKASLSSLSTVKKLPTRKWNVYDPEISAKSVLVHSLDDELPFYYNNTREPRVLASLTKLLTSIVVIEDIGLNKKIPITKKSVDTQGLSGDLKSGQSYLAQHLLKLMLLTSSNDAASAFEEYIGGQKEMVAKIMDKADKIDLSDWFSVDDGSGLSDFNTGTAQDFLKVTKYIVKNHPEIFSWTQTHDFLIQPINEPNERRVYNINSLVDRRDFWGGKTGTSQIAGENLVSIFNIKDRRVALIIMKSQNRNRDTEILINWVKEAYNFPKN